MKLARTINNESGVAALVMVIASLVIISLVGMNFVIDQQNKHQGAAVTVNAEQAQSVAEAGYRYAVKCLLTDDPACTCNSGGDCANWSTVPDIPVTPFGAASGSNFRVAFTDKNNCAVKISSTGTVNNTVRRVEDVLTRNILPGGGGVVTTSTPVADLGVPVPVPINILNHQFIAETSNGNLNIQFPNYTVPAGNNLVLVVSTGGLGSGSSAIPTGVTFGGTPMILADEILAGGRNPKTATGMFYLPVSSGDSGPITASFTGSTRNRALSIITLENALSPPEAVEDTHNSFFSISDNITTLSNNSIVISAAYSKTNFNITTTGAGHTEITGSNVMGEAEAGMGFVNVPTAGTTVTLGYQFGFGMTQVLAAFAPADPSVTISLPYTVPPGANEILVVSAGAEDGILPRIAGSTEPVSATYLGNPMNIIDTDTVASGGGGGTNFEAGLGLFWLPVTAGDSGNIQVTITNASIDESTIHAITLIGAQGPPEEIVSIVNDTTQPPNTIIAGFATPLTAGSMIVTGGYQGQRTTITAVPIGGGTHTIATQVFAFSSTGVMGTRPVPILETPTGIGWSAAFNRILLGMASFPPTGGGPCL